MYSFQNLQKFWTKLYSVTQRTGLWSDMTSVDTITQCREDWSSASVVTREKNNSNNSTDETQQLILLLKLIHTATPDTKKLCCLCRDRLRGVNWIPDETQGCRRQKIWSLITFRSIVWFAPAQQTRHKQDRLVLSGGGMNWALSSGRQ